MPGKPSAKHRDGRLGISMAHAKQKARKKQASDLHTENMIQLAGGLIHGLLDPKVNDGQMYEDDLFWNEQMSMRVNKMEEAHEKAKKVILIDKRVKPVPAVEDQEMWFKLSAKLPIPTRPKWDHSMSPKEVQAQERADFLEWRRAMAKVEEDEQVFLTPFEKNLEIWRQLWRVVERSDLVFSILDARNPLMFRNLHLEEYVRSHRDPQGRRKEVVLLLNKADLLTAPQRRAWARYFRRAGARFLFFSATRALKEVEEELTRLKKLAALEEAVELGDVEEEEAAAVRATLDPPAPSDLVQLDAQGHPVDSAHIFGRRDLLHYCHMYAKFLGLPGKTATPTPPPEPSDPSKPAPRKPRAKKGFTPKGVVVPQKVDLVVGFVGYPNVGKSSTINALFSTKRVVVSATPGKTKHFQTLVLDDVVTLCDCPGLVFPSFASTREGMICDGILPIATMRDHIAPMDLLLRRVKKEVLEMRYNIDLEWEFDEDGSTSFTELVLNRYARHRCIMTDHNKPNQSRAARELLLDYVEGRLLYVHPPPKHPDDSGDELDEEEEEEEAEVTDDDSAGSEAPAGSGDGPDGSEGYGEESEEEDEEEEELVLPADHPPDQVLDDRDVQFNRANVNLLELYDKMLLRKKRNKKKTRDSYRPVERPGTEHLVTVKADGTRVLTLDAEDGVVQLDVPRHKFRVKQPTKRALRQVRKAEHKSLNTRQLAVTGYAQALDLAHDHLA